MKVRVQVSSKFLGGSKKTTGLCVVYLDRHFFVIFLFYFCTRDWPLLVIVLSPFKWIPCSPIVCILHSTLNIFFYFQGQRKEDCFLCLLCECLAVMTVVNAHFFLFFFKATSVQMINKREKKIRGMSLSWTFPVLRFLQLTNYSRFFS